MGFKINVNSGIEKNLYKKDQKLCFDSYLYQENLLEIIYLIWFTWKFNDIYADNRESEKRYRDTDKVSMYVMFQTRANLY